MNHIRSLNMTKKLGLVVAIGMILGSLASVQGQSFLTNGLVAFYPFNGSANDASGNGNSITSSITGFFSSNRFGMPNSSVTITGQIYGIKPLGIAGNQSRTLAFWFMNPSGSDWLGIGFGNRSKLHGAFQVMAGTPQDAASFSFWAHYIDIEYQNTFALGRWHQMVFTYSSNITQMTAFLDGVPCSIARTVNDYGSDVTLDTVDTGVYLFSLGENRNRVDDLRIYNRELSPNEVAALYAWESQPVSGIRRSVYYTADNLTVGSNYQLQVSSDFLNWTNSGSVFTATNSSWRAPYYWDVENWNSLHFRLRQQ